MVAKFHKRKYLCRRRMLCGWERWLGGEVPGNTPCSKTRHYRYKVVHGVHVIYDVIIVKV